MENSIRIRYNTDELFPLNNLPQGKKERLTCQTSNNKLKKLLLNNWA